MAMIHSNITIIGGGMVGMSLALLIAHQNPKVSINLIDAHSFPDNLDAIFFQPSFDARSTVIAQGSMEIFETLGIDTQLKQHATAIKNIHISDAGHFMGGLINANDYEIEALGYVIPNEWIGRILLKQIRAQANIHLLPETRIESIVPKSTGAELRLKTATDTTILHTSLVVLADGSQSKLAQQLGIDFSVQAYEQTAIIANVKFSQLHQHIAYERFTPLGPIALLPLGKNASAKEAALVLTLPSKQAQEILEAPEEIFLDHLQKRFGQRLGKFLALSERKAFPLELIIAKEQVRSHLVLIGNAAHFLHPVAGQGFNLSLRDCQALSQTLHQYSPDTWGQLTQLQEYLALRATDQQKTIFFSDQLVKIFSSSQLSAIALRHLGIISLETLPALKNRLVTQTMGRLA